jgi:hypothetical protein
VSSPVDLVRLVYRKDGKALYAGVIALPEVATDQITFSRTSFSQMLELAGAALRQAPAARLLMQLEGAPYPASLSPQMEEWLRTDVTRAISALSVPPVHIMVRPTSPKVSRGLLYGRDTLADAIGDVVYLRLRTSGSLLQVEGVDGRWQNIDKSVQPPCAGGLILQQIHRSPGRSWAAVLTSHVLALHWPRYYLPRRWNPTESWISHGELDQLYYRYRKEKAHGD